MAANLAAGLLLTSAVGVAAQAKDDKSGPPRDGRAQVRQVQEKLKEKGAEPGAVDGLFGQQTKSAVKTFQQSSGLKATGSLDSTTLKALGLPARPMIW